MDWDRWPVKEYLAERYRELQPLDDAVLAHHSEYYRGFRPGELARTVEMGAGPNLYPLMLAAAASRKIDAVERSAACLRYLDDQLRTGPDPSWSQFWTRARRLNPDLPATLSAALSRVVTVPGDALAIPPGRYDAASMNFVAESVTEDSDEFRRFCTAFVGAVRPGGYLVAAFRENRGSYELGDGSRWPGYPVDLETVRATFAPVTTGLKLALGEGTILLTARRARR